MSTAKEIAEACGVSLSTVNKILRYPEAPFRESTRENVMAAARKLGYRPNASAVAVRTGRFDAVMLLQDVKSFRSKQSVAFYNEVAQQLEQRGQHLVFSRLDEQQLQSPEALKVFRQTMVDGIILNYHTVIPSILRQRLDELQLPWIVVNHRTDRDCVYPDEVGAGRQATEHLVSLGHQRIDYLDINYRADRAHKLHFSRSDRLQGYELAMQSAGLTPRAITAEQRPFDEPTDGIAFYRKLLSRDDRPTAYVLNYGLREILRLAVQELELSIPDDLSLVAIDPPELPVVFDATHTAVPWHEVGREAVELLLRRIEGKVKHTRPKTLPCRFESGETTGPPPAN